LKADRVICGVIVFFTALVQSAIVLFGGGGRILFRSADGRAVFRKIKGRQLGLMTATQRLASSRYFNHYGFWGYSIIGQCFERSSHLALGEH